MQVLCENEIAPRIVYEHIDTGHKLYNMLYIHVHWHVSHHIASHQITNMLAAALLDANEKRPHEQKQK